MRTTEGREMCAQLASAIAEHPKPEPPPPCSEHCFLLDHLALEGGFGQGRALRFVLTGTVRAKEETKVPLFGQAGQVQLTQLTRNGEPIQAALAEEKYVAFLPPGPFTLRGELRLVEDAPLIIKGPLNSLTAKLSHGRLVEGDTLSGIVDQTLHFDPMRPDAQDAPAKVPQTFRLSRALRIGKEIQFTYRVTVSQGIDLGSVTLPLAYDEKVREVSGATSWTQEGNQLRAVVAGKDADLTVTGTLPKLVPFTTSERSAYEWWMVEHEPDRRVTFAGEGKFVDNGQSPIPATLPTAKTVLVQRGQRFDVEAKPLIRAGALSAVARAERRFCAVTPSGETIIDDVLAYENNGQDSLVFTPAGEPMYVATDGAAEPIYRTEPGKPEIFVPMVPGAHSLRTQSVTQVRLRAALGLLSVPMHALPIATSASTVTVGLPSDVHPLAVFGGDKTKWFFTKTDGAALLIGALAALAGFRTRKTRALGVVATMGLWFVSAPAFVLALVALFCAGAIFVASRFLRGGRLGAAATVLVAVSLLVAKSGLSLTDEEVTRDLFAHDVNVPSPDSARPSGAGMRSKEAEIPLSLSMPKSDVYVQVERQLITDKQPFVPRVFYVTTQALSFAKFAWLGLLALLLFQFRSSFGWVRDKAKERLMRRPAPKATPENPWVTPAE